MDINDTKFYNAQRNIETEIAKKNIVLLQKYRVAKSAATRDKILGQMNPMVVNLLQKNKFSVDEFIARIKRAIRMDRYRPRNLSVFQFAYRDDLDFIKGEFDTFNNDLARKMKRDENAADIRDDFDKLTVNRYYVSYQFAHDWIRRLNKYPELVMAAKNATTQDEIAAYSALFSELTSDFCNEYNIDPHTVFVSVVTDWNTAVSRPRGLDKTYGICMQAFTMVLPSNMSRAEQDAEFKKFQRAPSKYPNAKPAVKVVVNIAMVKSAVKAGDVLFYHMISVFAHEMHHALDRLGPRMGAVGPQVMVADEKTYITSEENIDEYKKSATELSSYTVQSLVLKQLKAMDF
ncbi:MAG: hypothetical protein IJ560_00755 [Alphaproteobacteria bacterium]|nr:hypothetical protein [Alphaproteobacteria bacterium]